MKEKFWLVNVLSPYNVESDFDNLIAYMVEEKEYDASSTSTLAEEFIFKQGSDLANEISKYTTPHLIELDMDDFVESLFDHDNVSNMAFFHKETGGTIQAIPKILYQYKCRECLHTVDGDNTGVVLLERTKNDLDYLNTFTSYTVSKKIRSEGNVECKCKSKNLDFRNLALLSPNTGDEIPFIDINTFNLDFKNNQREYLHLESKKKGEQFEDDGGYTLPLEPFNIGILLKHLKNEIQILHNENRFISKDEGLFECILSYKQYDDSVILLKKDFLSTLKIVNISYIGFSFKEALDKLELLEKVLKSMPAKNDGKKYRLNF